MTLAEAIAHCLSSETYREVEQSASLKGLLKPFKGKGELLQFAETLQHLRHQLEALMTGMLAIMAQPPFSLLELRMSVQHSSQGACFLRWRSPDFKRMGVEAWVQAMKHPLLLPDLRQALYQLEANRVVLNLQMSSLNSLYRQVIAGAIKLGHADDVLSDFTTEEKHP
ncbi:MULTISPECIES: DUF3158 family protein [unclassified Pseudomonas]|uniref:DUF3158 family protein n=1 Tax=unclassified Pseudomonas TaxID=196821 RepID=UPI0035BF2639